LKPHSSIIYNVHEPFYALGRREHRLSRVSIVYDVLEPFYHLGRGAFADFIDVSIVYDVLEPFYQSHSTAPGEGQECFNRLRRSRAFLHVHFTQRGQGVEVSIVYDVLEPFYLPVTAGQVVRG